MIVFELTEWETLTLRAAISQHLVNDPKSQQTCRDILQKAKFEPHKNTRDTHDKEKLDKQLLEAVRKALETDDRQAILEALCTLETDERQAKFEPNNNAPEDELDEHLREALRMAWVERQRNVDEITGLRQEVTKLHAQNKQLRARIRAVAEAPTGTVFMAAGDRRKILRCLHPDSERDPARKKLLTEACTIFNGLPIRVA
jgi:hypothetical protein